MGFVVVVYKRWNMLLKLVFQFVDAEEEAKAVPTRVMGEIAPPQREERRVKANILGIKNGGGRYEMEADMNANEAEN